MSAATKTSSKPLLAMIDYGSGNLRSVAKAFEHCGAEVRVVSASSWDFKPDALILPGVGALGDCVAGLKKGGLDAVVRAWIGEQKPFFGICLGMQALFEHSEEGDVEGLGVFKGKVKRFELPQMYKIPHMGWNAVDFVQQTAVDAAIPKGSQYYFVHSYHCVPAEADLAWGITEYGEQRFVSAVRRGPCFATQFHPEKSQALGLKMYANFVNWLGSC